MQQSSPTPSPQAERSRKVDRPWPVWRTRLAGVALLLMAIWPVWSITDLGRHALDAHPPAAQALHQWDVLERRFMPVRDLLPMGTSLRYVPTRRVAIGDSRVHDVQFVVAPLIIVFDGRKPIDLILADLYDDDELRAFLNTGRYEVIHHVRPGLAVVREHHGDAQP